MEMWKGTLVGCGSFCYVHFKQLSNLVMISFHHNYMPDKILLYAQREGSNSYAGWHKKGKHFLCCKGPLVQIKNSSGYSVII